LRIEGHEAAAFALFVRAGIGDDAIEPGRKFRVAAKLRDDRKKLQESGEDAALPCDPLVRCAAGLREARVNLAFARSVERA